MHKIRTEAILAAPPDRVFAVLADFERYREWNPLTLKASGRAALGARVPMTFVNPGRPGVTISQTVKVTACDPGRKLEWVGRIPLIFTGRHFFELEPWEGGTRLRHGEDLSGYVAWTIRKSAIAEHFVPAYEALNTALAARLAKEAP